jgi:hypothetical protein
MAAKLLLPGYGGAYTSEEFTASSTIGADTIDVSPCRGFLAQISMVSGAGDIQLEQTANLSDWADLGTAISVGTDGAVTRFEDTDGPFGLLRIDATGITAGTVVVTLVGF